MQNANKAVLRSEFIPNMICGYSPPCVSSPQKHKNRSIHLIVGPKPRAEQIAQWHRSLLLTKQRPDGQRSSSHHLARRNTPLLKDELRHYSGVFLGGLHQVSSTAQHRLGLEKFLLKQNRLVKHDWPHRIQIAGLVKNDWPRRVQVAGLIKIDWPHRVQVAGEGMPHVGWQPKTTKMNLFSHCLCRHEDDNLDR